MIGIPGVRIRVVSSVLALCLLVAPACGRADTVVAPRGVRHQARVARAELRRAGWRLTLILPAFTTSVCGGRRTHVRMSVSAVDPRAGGTAGAGRPHMTAWLFRRPREAAVCLDRFVAASGGAAGVEGGRVHVVRTRAAVRVAARAGRYLVIASSDGPLAPLRRATDRALVTLGVT